MNESNKTWYIHEIEYYSVIKRDEQLNHKKKDMGDQKLILLSERNQPENITYYMITSNDILKEKNCRDSENISSCQDFGERGEKKCIGRIPGILGQ